jgi:hypothetical protein
MVLETLRGGHGSAKLQADHSSVARPSTAPGREGARTVSVEPKKTGIERRRNVIRAHVAKAGTTPPARIMTSLLAAAGFIVGRSTVHADYLALGLAKPPERRAECLPTGTIAGLCDDCRQWIPDRGDGRAHLPLTRHGIFCEVCCPVCTTH